MTIQQAHQHVFAEVLKISKHRILQRLVPPWVAAPAHWTSQQKKKRTSLFHRSGLLSTTKEVTVLPPFMLSHTWLSLLTNAWNKCLSPSTPMGSAGLVFEITVGVSELCLPASETRSIIGS